MFVHSVMELTCSVLKMGNRMNHPGKCSSLDSITRRSAVFAAVAGVSQLPFVKASPITPTEVKSVIFIFLSGGLAQQDTFDPKPDAPLDIRGEFSPISTASPGLQICEHLPMLAARSDKWSVVRSLSHPYNEHSQGHMVMLSGRTELPTGFNPSLPKPTDHPSIAALMGAILPERNGLPSSVVLPEKLIHRSGRVIPGQFAGSMGKRLDPWFLSSSRFNAKSYGAWPEFEFHHQRGGEVSGDLQFRTPGLALPDGMSKTHLDSRLQLLNSVEHPALTDLEETASFARYRERAIAMLGDGRLNKMFDIQHADPQILDRYGRNSFGWSLMLARRLVEEGVAFVQVNLGNNETWDTHGNAFPHLKDYLLPPMDRSVSALLDDLDDRGLLETTLVVMAGEFGRTPKVFRLPAHYAQPGRDHWGAVQSLLLAGSGFCGGRVIGETDSHGGQPIAGRQSAENLAATMYAALGIPRDMQWFDLQDRPMQLYNGSPIPS